MQPRLSPSTVLPESTCVVVDLTAASELDPAGLRSDPDQIVVGIQPTGVVSARMRMLGQACDVVFAEPSGSTAEQHIVVASHPPTAAAAFINDVDRNPHAALLLAKTLQMNSQLTIADGLQLESLAYSVLLTGPEFRRWLSTLNRPRVAEPVTDLVLTHRVGDVLKVTLNQPSRRNAYSAELRNALVSALDVALADSTIEKVVLTGHGPVFCAGGDLAEFGTTDDFVASHFIRTRGGAALPLSQLSQRLEVRVQGSCVGAGTELAAFASRLVADRDAVFRLPEVAMGLIPGAGGTVSIPRRIGRWRTLWLAVSGEGIPADTALAWGLIDEIQPTLS